MGVEQGVGVGLLMEVIRKVMLWMMLGWVVWLGGREVEGCGR